MTKTLLERVREEQGAGWHSDLSEFFKEIGDTLEAQQKRIDKLEADYLKTHNWLCDRNEQLAVSQGRKTKLAAELAASQAQIKVLRDALESIGNGFHESHQVHAVIKHALAATEEL